MNLHKVIEDLKATRDELQQIVDYLNTLIENTEKQTSEPTSQASSPVSFKANFTGNA